MQVAARGYILRRLLGGGRRLLCCVSPAPRTAGAGLKAVVFFNLSSRVVKQAGEQLASKMRIYLRAWCGCWRALSGFGKRPPCNALCKKTSRWLAGCRGVELRYRARERCVAWACRIGRDCAPPKAAFYNLYWMLLPSGVCLVHHRGPWTSSGGLRALVL